MAITADHVADKYYQAMDDIKKSNFKLLDLLHHYTSGMKSVFTQDTHDGMNLIR